MATHTMTPPAPNDELDARRRHETGLQADRDRFRQLVEGSLQGVLVHRDFRPLFANRALAEILGYDSVGALLAVPSLIVHVPRSERPRLTHYVRDRLAGHGPPQQFETRLLRCDGTPVWVELLATTVTWEGAPAILATLIDHTERKRAELEHLATQRTYHKLLEGSIQGVVVHREHRPLFADEAFARIFGFDSVGEVMALDSLLELVAPQEREQVRTYREARLRGEAAPARYAFLGVRRDGRPVWVENLCSLVDWEGAPAIQTTTIDISERVQARQRLEASERRYRELFENFLYPNAIHVDFRPVQVNRAFAGMLGYASPEAFLQTARHEAPGFHIAPAFRAEAMARHEARLRGEPCPPVVRWQALRRDGSPVWLESSHRVLEWEGRPAIHSVYMDITERMETRRALEDSEARYRDLVEGSIQGIMIHRDHRPLFANQGFAEMLGFASAEEVRALDSILPYVAPREVERVLAYHEARLRGEPAPERYDLEMRRRDGTPVWCEVIVRGITWKGQPARQGTFIDITERKRAERALAVSEQRHRDLVEGSIQGIMIHRGHRILFANQAYADIFGFDSPEELYRLESSLALRAPHERQRMAGYAETRLRGEPAPVRYEFQGLRRDGSVIWLENTVRVVEWDGQPALQNVCIDITERKRAVDALRQSESRFRDLVEGSIQGIAIHQDHRVVFANQAYADMFGYRRPEELTGLDMMALRPEHERERLRRYARARLRGEPAPERYEFQGLRRDGSVIWLENLVRMVQWAGQPAFQIICVDISERKRAVDALRQSESRFRDLVEGSLQGMFIHRDFRMRFANAALARILGYGSVEAVLAQDSVFEWVAPRDRARIRAYGEGRMRGEAPPTHYEVEALRRDGVPITLEVQSRLVEWEGEAAIQSTIFDVTQRKRAERALAQSQAHLAGILDTAVDGIVTINERGMIETFNRAASDIFGYAPHEVIGRNVSMLMPSPYAEDHDAYIRRYLETGRSHIIGIGREVTGLRADGTLFPAMLEVSEVRSGGRVAFTGIVRDITEQKRARELLIESNRAKSAFISNMSHELRAPMNAILGFSQLLQREPNLTAGQQEDLNIIVQSGHHLLELINDVLDLHKIEAGHLSIAEEEFDLPATLETLMGMFRLRSENRRLTLELSVAPEAPRYVRGDRRKLRQVLINLVGNAVKFTEAGRITLAVEADPAMAEGVAFSVRDTGRGIPDGELETILEPFRQSAGTEGGTGLGLAISKSFVELMGGTLRVCSTLGEGSDFHFTVPLPRLGTEQVSPGPVRRVAGIRSARKVEVLIVDDDPYTRQYLGQLLRAVGFRTSEAVRGEDALALCAPPPPDALLVDLRLSGMSGGELVRRLRALPAGARPVAVGMTANALQVDQPEGTSTELERILLKPLSEERVLEALGDALGLEYEYEQPDAACAPAAVPAEWDWELLRTQVSGEVRRALHDAHAIGDMDALHAEARSLSQAGEPAVARLGEFLMDLVARYRDAEIGELLRHLPAD